MSQEDLGTHPQLKKVINILRIVAAPLLLLIILLRVDLREIAETFRHIRLLPFAVAAALVTVNFAMLIFKWHYLLSESTIATKGQTVRSVIGGFAFVLATPGQVGEFSRVLFFPGESKLRLMGLVAIDKSTAFAVTALVSSFSLVLWRGGIFYLPFLIVLGLLVLLASRPRLFVAWAMRLARKLPWKDKTTLFLEGYRRLSTRRILTLLLMSLLYFLIYSTQFYLLLRAFQDVTLKTMTICFPLVMLANSLPITIGGLGVREGAAVLFFSQFGIPEPSALSAALLLFTINILIPGLCGLAFVHHIGAKPKSLPEKEL